MGRRFKINSCLSVIYDAGKGKNKTMKKILLATMLVALTFIFACKLTVPIINGKTGCWYEKELDREVCGVAEKYTAEDSIYVMRTYDGWAMKIKSEKINWK